MSWIDAIGTVGGAMSVAFGALIVLVLLLNGAFAGAKAWDRWRCNRRRNRAYRPRKYADP